MLFFITVTVLVASANAKFYTDCGSQKATIQSISVTDCKENAKVCQLHRNTNVTFGIDFTPLKEVQEVTTVVHGVIMNLPVPFPLPQPDACKDDILSCPLSAGKKVEYRTSMPILNSYPKVRVDVKWELKDENDEDLVCILIPAKIV